ncbi:MAG TPA: sulfate/molybdate ABC transporter ATP-binding protein [Allosphingosinicella sp.]
MSIRVDNVVKRFGSFAALNGVSLEAEPGEFLALLGPSGSGKTTLLRIMAGLEFPDDGAVLFEGRDVTGLGVRDRRIGFVFQHYALFPHMNVADNVAFGLTVKRRRDRPKRAEIMRRSQELLELVQLGGLGKRYPAQLSGGQRQRVALARALAVEPKLLLLDEPFGALDAKVRKELRRWLRDLHDRMGLTSVFVTHDQEEALELADRVVVMDHGLIEQVAGPQTIYDEPASAFVYDFVGDSNRLSVTIDEGRVLFDGRALDVPVEPSPNGPASLYFRPHDATLVEEGAAGALPMQIVQAIHLGGVTRIEGKIAGVEPLIDVRIGNREVPEAGRAVGLRLSRARLFPASAGGA